MMEQNTPNYFETLNPDTFTDILPIESIDHTLPIQIVSTGLRDILLPIKNFESLASLQPDFKQMACLSTQYHTIGVHAFTLHHDQTITAICRNFAPLYGINEESATGTSNCALACYLNKYAVHTNSFIFEQGYNLNAPSRIIVELKTEQNEIKQVVVGGYGYLVREQII